MRTSILVAMTLAAAAMAQEAQQFEPRPLTFGVYSFKRPTDVLRDFAPAVHQLGQSLTKEMARPVHVDVKVFRTYEECLERFVAGDVDFVRVGPASYVIAKQRNPDIQLLVAEQEDGQKRCKGVIAVRANSPIRTVNQLAGRSFAFGDQNSTIGRYLSQAVLWDAGIRQQDLGNFAFLERHDRVFKAVEAGDYDAGAMHLATFQEMNKKEQLREIARFDNVGKPWVARAGLDEATTKALRTSLLGLVDPDALQALKVHGLLPTVDADFDLVRHGMVKAEQFAAPPARPSGR